MKHIILREFGNFLCIRRSNFLRILMQALKTTEFVLKDYFKNIFLQIVYIKVLSNY